MINDDTCEAFCAQNAGQSLHGLEELQALYVTYSVVRALPTHWQHEKTLFKINKLEENVYCVLL